MADVQTSGSSSNSNRSRSRSRKRSSIDMTAMVDVAFLLLTFFVLTSTLQKHSIMKMIAPPMDDIQPYTPIDESKIMTIVLDSADLIQYFVGMTDAEVKNCDFEQVRGVIQDFIYTQQPLCRDAKQKGLSHEPCWDPMFLIKAKSSSSYKNLVDILDEMAIANVPKYSLDVLNENDLAILEQRD